MSPGAFQRIVKDLPNYSAMTGQNNSSNITTSMNMLEQVLRWRIYFQQYS